MNRILLFTLLSLISVDGIAQSLEAIFRGTMGKNHVLGIDREAPEVVGHPYAHNVWSKGSFRTVGNSEYTDVEMKFEAYTNALVILYRSDSMLVRPEVVREFDYSVGNQTFFFRNGFETSLEDLTSEKYLMVISEGLWSIYKEVRKTYKKSDFDPTYHTGSRYDSYQEQHRYFVKSPDGEWSQLRINRRNLTRLFGEKGREVDQYIRQRQMDIENDAHLSHIFEFATGLE